MINLEQISGLPIEVTQEHGLKFMPPLGEFSLTFARKFSDMLPVLLDQAAKISADETYYVYRGIHLPKHKDLIYRNRLTYDITILPPLMLGQEFNKTVGHYHANIPGSQIAHPELYEVLHGHGLFILQKMDDKFEKVLDVIVIEAKKGDKIVYPPNYGHNFVNLGSDVLITANWVSVDYKPLYEPIVVKHGMAYFAVWNSQFDLVVNNNYSDVPPTRKTKQSASEFAIVRSNKPMYLTGMNNPKTLEFLNHPENYEKEFASLTS